MDERQGSERASKQHGRLGRRGVLKAGLVASAVAGTGAWRMAPSARPLRQPGSLPYPGLPAGTDTIPQIEHIVVLMQENHSYDNRLGMLMSPAADGFRLGGNGLPTATNPYPTGQIQHAFRMPATCQLSSRPGQEWTASHNAYDNGRMDGFVRTPNYTLVEPDYSNQSEENPQNIATLTRCRCSTCLTYAGRRLPRPRSRSLSRSPTRRR